MAKLILVGLTVFFISGCFAVVDNRGDVSNVKAFIMTDDEALDLLERAEAKSPEEKYEIKLFKGD